MTGNANQYELVFGPVEGASTAHEYARGSRRNFVRSQFQLAFDSEKATGARLSAFEALQAFGWDRLAEVGEQGVSLISSDLKGIYKSFNKQLDNAGLGFDDVATKADWTDEEKIDFSRKGRTNIDAIRRLASIIGFDERIIGVPDKGKPDRDVAVRMRQFGVSDAVRFSTTLKMLLLEASWIIERQYTLVNMLEECGILRPAPLFGVRWADSDYGSGHIEPWMRGFSLAQFLRKELSLSEIDPIESMRRLVEDQFGIPVVLVRYPGKFAGATIQANGYRGIVINISGSKGSPLTRRTTLAHELCHILFDDRSKLHSLHVDFDDTMIDYTNAENDEVEKRANAFAIEFLANRRYAHDKYIESYNYQDTLLELVDHYGVSVGAMRQHIANSFKVSFDKIASVSAEVDLNKWKIAENSLTDFLPAPHEMPENKQPPAQRLSGFAYYIALCRQNKLISHDSATLMLNCQSDQTDVIIASVLELHPASPNKIIIP